MVSRRAASISVAMSASFHWIAWNSANAFSELASLLGIFEGGLVGALGHAERQGGDRDPATVQHPHCIHKALAFYAQQILMRDDAIFKNQFGSIAGAQSELVFFFARTETLGALLHDEGGEAVGMGGAVSNRDHHHHVGVVAVGEKRLGAVQHPGILATDRGHARAAGVGTGRRARSGPMRQ